MKNTKETLKLAFEQMLEDRETIKASYETYRTQITNIGDYAMCGGHINKCLELLTKQTGQLLELAKLQNAEKSDNVAHLTSADAEGVYNLINGGKEVKQRSGNK